MPIRNRIVTLLTEDVVGAQWWDNSAGSVCMSMPTDDYDRTRDAAEVLYERIVDRIDWNRILIEASSRHFDLCRAGTHPERSGSKAVYWEDLENTICPDCLREAMLADDTRPRHSPDPALRVDSGQDWAGEITAMRVKHGKPVRR